MDSLRAALASHFDALWQLTPIWRAVLAMPAPDFTLEGGSRAPSGRALRQDAVSREAAFAMNLDNSQLGGGLPICHYRMKATSLR